MSLAWYPKVGDLVWLNHPDSDEPEGRVVEFVPDDAENRAGQPIIEALEDDIGPFSKRKKGDRFVIHPAFLLPFAFGGPEWKEAEAQGRVG